MPQHNEPMTPARRGTFLRVLAETGSFSAAARAGSPGSVAETRGLGTWRHELRCNPEFAQAVEDAKQAALGEVERTIWDRAMNGTDEPVYQGGQLVGRKTVHDNRLLLRLAARLSPEWRESSKVEVESKSLSVNVHQHVARLSVEDLSLLEDEDRAHVLRLLAEIAWKKEQNARRLAAEQPLEVGPPPIPSPGPA